MPPEEPKTVGMADDTKAMLSELSGQLGFKEEMEAFRLAVAVALVLQPRPESCPEIRGLTTTYNIGSLDREGKLQQAVLLFNPNYEGSVYKLVERLADWGIRWMRSKCEHREMSASELLSEIDVSRARMGMQ